MEDSQAMTPQKTIVLAHDFTDAPGGRYRWQGDFSGEEFRDDVLVPALQEASTVIIDLNNALGLPSSFLDEAFGEVTRQHPEYASRIKIQLSDNIAAKEILGEIFNSNLI